MNQEFSKFKGTSSYIADAELQDAVNVAIALERPLLVRGEPGTGKTLLARAIAESLGAPLITWHIKSTSRAQEGLYHYDTVQRLNDSRFTDDGRVEKIENYIKLGPLGQALESERRAVLLIDEIDKADLEFPNDLLHELDDMSFYIPELDKTVTAKHRPIVIITSNAEKELPAPFLRRCVFHYIPFPEKRELHAIVDVHFPELEDRLVDQLLGKFLELRNVRGLRKKPSTSELIDWITALQRAGLDLSKERGIPFISVLLKKEQDLKLVQ